MGHPRVPVRRLIALCLILACAPPAGAQQERTVTVTLTALDHNAEPIAELRVFCGVEDGSRDSGTTDKHGVVVLHVEGVGAEVHRLRYGPMMHKGSPKGLVELTRTNAFFIRNFVSLAPWQDSVQVTLAAKPAVTVRARVVDSDGNPLDSWVPVVEKQLTITLLGTKPAPTCEIPGVAANSKHVAWIRGSGLARRIEFIAGDSDVDLGEIRIPKGDATVHVSMSPWDASRGSVAGAMFFAFDGSFVVTHSTDYNGVVKQELADGTRTSDISLPSGKYYVVPGWFVAEDWQRGIVARLRAGDTAALDGAGIPSIVATPDENRSLSIDLEKVVTAAWEFALPDDE